MAPDAVRSGKVLAIRMWRGRFWHSRDGIYLHYLQQCNQRIVPEITRAIIWRFDSDKNIATGHERAFGMADFVNSSIRQSQAERLERSLAQSGTYVRSSHVT
jgi:hypothetical protein